VLEYRCAQARWSCQSDQKITIASEMMSAGACRSRARRFSQQGATGLQVRDTAARRLGGNAHARPLHRLSDLAAAFAVAGSQFAGPFKLCRSRNIRFRIIQAFIKVSQPFWYSSAAQLGAEAGHWRRRGREHQSKGFRGGLQQLSRCLLFKISACYMQRLQVPARGN